MGEPIKECWDRRQYHTGLAHIKRNRRTQFGILGAAIKPKWDGPTYPKGMTQLTNVAGPTLVKPAGPLQVSGLKILTSFYVSCWNECRGVVFKKIRVAIGQIFYKKSILGDQSCFL